MLEQRKNVVKLKLTFFSNVPLAKNIFQTFPGGFVYESVICQQFFSLSLLGD